METNKSISDLVEKYLTSIEIWDIDFVPFDDADSDAAYIRLELPKAMLKEYLAIKKQNKELPDVEEFWKDTGLADKLDSKNYRMGHEDLVDIIELLRGAVCGDYQSIIGSKMTRMSVYEVVPTRA